MLPSWLILWALSRIRGFRNRRVSETGSVSYFGWQDKVRNPILLDPSPELVSNPRPAFPKLVGREKFLKCEFFNYIIIKNHKKWKIEKTKQN
jgi:hypothetical protein